MTPGTNMTLERKLAREKEISGMKSFLGMMSH